MELWYTCGYLPPWLDEASISSCGMSLNPSCWVEQQWGRAVAFAPCLLDYPGAPRWPPSDAGLEGLPCSNMSWVFDLRTKNFGRSPFLWDTCSLKHAFSIWFLLIETQPLVLCSEGMFCPVCACFFCTDAWWKLFLFHSSLSRLTPDCGKNPPFLSPPFSQAVLNAVLWWWGSVLPSLIPLRVGSFPKAPGMCSIMSVSLPCPWEVSPATWLGILEVESHPHPEMEQLS